MSVLRPITPADHAAVLAWNEAHVELLSPLDEAGLVELLGWSDPSSSVISLGGRDLGFVITIGAGTAYGSTNYRWFAARHPSFLYLDRIVIDPAARRTGAASRTYDAIEARARDVGPVLCLEVNLDPPNEPSLAFHRARGFVEVGQEQAHGHLVSLLEKDVSAVRSVACNR
ncbi:MAG: family N-acetyltransferase [Marmoricola sp.]|nr:family N-acetyltransferase [Marmoricola sp.]